MASCNDFTDTTGSTSPLPRAPPPSPECPTHILDLTQFDFHTLLSDNKKNHTFNQSPVSSSPVQSGNNSPSWNESESYNSHSPFFLPSPERPQTVLSDPPSPVNISVPSRGTYSQVGYHDVTQEPCPSNQILSISLPVNGELHNFQSTTQHESRPLFLQSSTHLTMETGNPLESGERRRKISLKRPHELAEESWYSLSCDQTWLHHNDIIQKKLCSDVRDRESHDFNPRNLYTHRMRSNTHSGVPLRQKPLSAEFNRMFISRENPDSFSQAPRSHTPTSFPGLPYQSHLGSHVIPQATQTIGFVTEDASTDIPMEMGDVGTAHPTKISITKAESVDYNLMDCSGHAPSTSSFAFSLDSSNFNPGNLHPYNGGGNGLMGGAYNQDTPTCRITNEVLSHSL